MGDYFDGDKRLDVVVRGQRWDTPEQLAGVPLATPAGGLLPVGELTRVVRTAGPNQIRRIDRRRTVTLQVSVMQRAMASGQRIFEVVDVPISIENKPDAVWRSLKPAAMG